MDQRQVNRIIKRFKEQLVSLKIRPSCLILFGSFASGESQQDSDIDLVVISEDFHGKNLRERLEILGVAAARILEPIEAFGVTEEEWGQGEWLFLKEAAKDGVVYT